MQATNACDGMCREPRAQIGSLPWQVLFSLRDLLAALEAQLAGLFLPLPQRHATDGGGGPERDLRVAVFAEN